MAARTYGQYCGVATAVDLIGERWALLIVRDLLVGPRRYSDLKTGLPRIPTNILSTRLKELQAAGIIRRVPLAHGLAYSLTDIGRGLEDVILALGRWGFQEMGEPAADDVITPDSMTIAFRTAFQPAAAMPLPPTVYDAHLDDFALRVRVKSAQLRVTRLDADHTDSGLDRLPHLAFHSGPALRKLISGELRPADAVKHGAVQILSGDRTLLDRFARTFHLEAAS